MKIVCDACSAKYSIADDKVKGKVFKIRCKKCSNIIVVRGSAGAAEEPAPAQYDQKETRVYDYQGYDGAAPGGDESVWHVVIDQEQVGPMTMAEVQQRFSAGQIDGDTYVWREGFADWQPLSAVDVFAHLAAGAPAGGGGAAAVASMFGAAPVDDGATTRADSGDLFAAAAASSAAADDDEAGSDLFGSRGAAAAAVQAPAHAQAQAQAQAQSRLRGERNENSVLFSLGNLAQLASDAPRAAAAPAASPGAAAGPAGGEGSGLIDIRSMASAYLGDKGAAKPASGGIGSMDDLPVFASTAFNEPAVLMPTGGSRANNNKLLYALIALVGVLAIVAVVMVIKVLGSNNAKPAAAQVAKTDGDKAGTDNGTPDKTTEPPGTQEPAANPGSAAAVEPGSGSSTQGAGTTPPDPTTTPDTGKPDKPDTGKPDTGKTDTHHSSSSKPDKGSSKPDRGSSKPDTSSTKPDTSTKPDSGGSCDEVSCVLNNYEGSCCQKFKKGGSGKKPDSAGTTKPASDLPESLDRGAVQAGVNQVKARVQACGSKSSAKGEVKVSVKVGPDGKVTGTTVKTTPDAALGSCVASAMAKATFAKTQKGGSFAYPWKF